MPSAKEPLKYPRIGIVGRGEFGKLLATKFRNAHIEFHVGNDSDWSKLLHKVDLVVVATPTHTRYSIVKTCLASGTHVFCEKPLTENFQATNELLSLASQNNLDLYIDTVFLLRNELLSIQTDDIREIKLHWHKNDPNPAKDPVLHRLTFHDLYILSAIFQIYSLTEIQCSRYTPNEIRLQLIRPENPRHFLW